MKRGVLELLKSGLSESTEIVLLNGDDEYLHSLAIKKIEADVVDADFRDFNFRELVCSRTTTRGAVDNILSELPTLVDRRLVVLQEVSKLPKPVSKDLADSWKEALAPGTVVIATAGGAVKGSPLWTSLSKAGESIECRLKEPEIDRLLGSFAKRVKKKVDRQALVVLKERLGLDTRTLISHLERCLLSLSDGETLDAETVERLVPFSAEVAMWKLTRAIGERNHRAALAIIDNQLQRGEQPGPIFGYINSYLTSLVQTGGLMKQHRNTAAVAAAMPRRTEYQVKKTLEDLRTWSASDLTEGFDALTRADYKSKGGEGGTDPRLLLQMLVLKLCSRKQGRRRG